MSLIIKGLLALFWLVLTPACAGIAFLRKKNSYTLGECFFSGYLFLFSVSELLILPATYFHIPLHCVVLAIGGILVCASGYGVFCFRRSALPFFSETRQSLRNTSPFFWCSFILILMQICIVVLYAHFDADDAFYVGTATTSVYNDSIFVVNPYTGINYRNLPSRYILSPFPIFLAVVSQLCNGLHPAITAHVVFPAVFQALTYIILYQFARKWFPSDPNRRGIFLFAVAALNCFADYSVYNAGSFQMVRIWQGKALLASAFLPLLLYLCLSVAMEEEPRYPWKLLFLGNLSCCLLSSMGIMLAPILQGIFILFSFIKFKNLKHLGKSLACCLPSLILGVVYLAIR